MIIDIYLVSRFEHPFHKVAAESAKSMSRQQLIEWLTWCDANGIWSDADAQSEGYEPLTLIEAYQAVIQIINSSI